VDPFQRQVGPDLLDQANIRKDTFVLMINPAISNIPCQDFAHKSVIIIILLARVHIMKIMKVAIIRHQFRIERFKHEAAWDWKAIRSASQVVPLRAVPATRMLLLTS